MIAAEDMIDKGKNPADLRQKVLQAGGTINRPELAETEDND